MLSKFGILVTIRPHKSCKMTIQTWSYWNARSSQVHGTNCPLPSVFMILSWII